MFGTECSAAGRSTGLVDHRGALWRWFGHGRTWNLEEFTFVFDVVNFSVVRKDTGFAVELDGVVFPGSFQQLIDDFQVFIGVIVSTIVFHLIVITHVAGSRRQVPGHNVPTNTTPVR